MAKAKGSLKCLSVAMMALMMVFAMTVGSFAMEVGEYEASLAGPAGMPHDPSGIIAGNAVVATDGETDTVTIPLQEMVIGMVTGTVVSVVCVTPGYTAALDGDNLVVTCSHDTDVSDFSPMILFTIDRSDGGDHTSMPATLTLTPIDQAVA